MKNSSALIIIMAIIIAIISGLFVVLHNGSPLPAATTTLLRTTINSTSTANSSMVKLSDTQYANSAYLISGPNLTQNESIGLSGFRTNRTLLANGSIRIVLSSYTGISNSIYTIKQTQKLYFIDGSLGDDSPPNGEYGLGDDGVVLTDINGYIIRG